MNHKKPTALKKMEGTYRKDRAVQNEIMPTIEINSTPPDDLNEWGKGLWVDTFNEYGKIGLITKMDTSSLMALCFQFGTMCEAQDIIAAQGLQIEENVYSSKGELCGTKTVTNPMVKVASDSFKNYKAMCVEFGMTPVSRSRINAPENKQNENPFVDF